MSKIRAGFRFTWRLARAPASLVRWLAGGLREFSPARHPLIVVGVVSVAGAGLGLLVIIVLATAVARAPVQLGHAYQDYFNGVSQQFQQACEQTRGPDCQQYWPGTP